MYFELGNCDKHGVKQVFATPPNSQFSVCVRCCSEFFIGHNLRQLIRRDNVVESKTLLPEVGYAPRPASASGPRSSDKDSGK